ncbi:hypothetical protein ACMAY6_01260 [Luminiphilus sp. nBUS_16]|uniref:hypothetical protein n=1 Tax=Luminiphilus sp. nBUS_16 TaxID=3395315 RepID=UPI003EBA7C45
MSAKLWVNTSKKMARQVLRSNAPYRAEALGEAPGHLIFWRYTRRGRRAYDGESGQKSKHRKAQRHT